jgi:hypothetical protein
MKLTFEACCIQSNPSALQKFNDDFLFELMNFRHYWILSKPGKFLHSPRRRNNINFTRFQKLVQGTWETAKQFKYNEEEGPKKLNLHLCYSVLTKQYQTIWDKSCRSQNRV